MEISEKNEPVFKSLRCRFIPNNEHFLKDAKILPCEKLVCVECIQKAILISENNKLTCSLCNSEHIIENIDTLKTGSNVLDQINSDDLTEEIEQKIKQKVLEIQTNLNNKSEIIEKICIQVKGDITKRVSLVKDHLESLRINLMESLASIKEKAHSDLIVLNTEAEKTVENSEKLTENLKIMFTEFEENREKIESDIYECQAYISDLDALSEKFRTIMRKIIFEPSDWMPDKKVICPTIENFEINKPEVKLDN